MTLGLTRGDLLRNGNLIGAEWRSAGGGRHYDVCDPATGQPFTSVPDSGPEDATAAVDAAHHAFPRWSSTSPRDRSRTLRRWLDLVLDNGPDLARLISREQGKPLAEASGEVAYGASYIEWFAEEAVRCYGDVIPDLDGVRSLTVIREPIGIVAAITPWNFPLAMIARKIAPAIAAGCTVVAKPAEDTPLTALALVHLAEEAGLPAGVVNIITCSRARVDQTVGAWLDDPRVRKLTFTGSTAVGKHLAREAAATLKKLSLELGGNAPFIVFQDADLDAAVEGLLLAKFRNGGQTCVSPNRVYVQRTVHDEFAARLTDKVRGLRVGPASLPDSQIGPMINSRAVEKIERHVQDALSKGAVLLAGGHRVRDERTAGSQYFAPTVLTGACRDMLLFSEETFGPVVPLFRFDREDEVLDEANDTPYGLAAYFYTVDPSRLRRVAARLQTGMVGINAGVLSSAAAPFGGIKESGYGREGSRYGLEDYTQTKYLCQGELA